MGFIVVQFLSATCNLISGTNPREEDSRLTVDWYSCGFFKVYGKEVYENISVVIFFSKKVDGLDTLYMYMVEKSKAQLTAMAEDEILNNVFRATFIQDKSTANDWDLKLLPDGSPDVRKGSSVVKNYEGQTDGMKTFGFYSKEEIWVEN